MLQWYDTLLNQSMDHGMNKEATAEIHNEEGLSYYREALKAESPREKRRYWALALRSWRKGLDLNSNHLSCQINRLYALLALGTFQTTLREAKDLLAKLLSSNEPECSQTNENLNLAWDPLINLKNSGFQGNSNVDNILTSQEKAQYVLARLIAQYGGVCYRPETLPYWRLSAFINPSDLEAQLITAINSANQLQIEGLYHLQKLTNALTVASDKESIRTCHKLASMAYLNYIQGKGEEIKDIDENELSDKKPKPEDEKTQEVELSIEYEGYRLYLEPDLRNVGTIVMASQKAWFESEVDYCKRVIKPGMTVIDVGANVGAYTFLFSRYLNKSGKVLAIEPTPDCAKCLHKTVAQNQLLETVMVVEAVIGKNNGEAFLAKHSSSVFNRIVKDPMSVREETIAVQQIQLDSLWEQENFPKIDFVKIDTGTCDIGIFEGGAKMLESCHPQLLFEYQPDKEEINQVINFITEIGYFTYSFNPHIQDLSPIQLSVQAGRAMNIIALHHSQLEHFSQLGLI